MALQPFLWGNGGEIKTPNEAARTRAIAEALMPRQVATNPWEGLAQVAGAFTGSQLNNRVSDAEEAGQVSAAEALSRLSGGGTQSDIIAALSNPWLSGPQASVASALLSQNLERSDPMYQLQRQKLERELELMGQPKPQDPTSSIQNYEYLVGTGVDPKQALEMSFGGGGTTINNMGTIPAGYQLVTNPETGAQSMAPIPGSPAALEAEQNAIKADVRSRGLDTVTDTIVSEAQKAREAAKGFASTGVGNFLTGGMGFTPAAQVNQHVDSLKAIASSENINAMRQASPTGGALGNTSDADLKLLQNKAGALNPQSATFERDLADYEKTLLRIVHGPEAGDAIYEATRPEAQGSSSSEGWTDLGGGIRIRPIGD